MLVGCIVYRGDIYIWTFNKIRDNLMTTLHPSISKLSQKSSRLRQLLSNSFVVSDTASACFTR